MAADEQKNDNTTLTVESVVSAATAPITCDASLTQYLVPITPSPVAAVQDNDQQTTAKITDNSNNNNQQNDAKIADTQEVVMVKPNPGVSPMSNTLNVPSQNSTPDIGLSSCVFSTSSPPLASASAGLAKNDSKDYISHIGQASHSTYYGSFPEQQQHSLSQLDADVSSLLCTTPQSGNNTTPFLLQHHQQAIWQRSDCRFASSTPLDSRSSMSFDRKVPIIITERGGLIQSGPSNLESAQSSSNAQISTPKVAVNANTGIAGRDSGIGSSFESAVRDVSPFIVTKYTPKINQLQMLQNHQQQLASCCQETTGTNPRTRRTSDFSTSSSPFSPANPEHQNMIQQQLGSYPQQISQPNSGTRTSSGLSGYSSLSPVTPDQHHMMMIQQQQLDFYGQQTLKSNSRKRKSSGFSLSPIYPDKKAIQQNMATYQFQQKQQATQLQQLLSHHQLVGTAASAGNCQVQSPSSAVGSAEQLARANNNTGFDNDKIDQHYSGGSMANRRVSYPTSHDNQRNNNIGLNNLTTSITGVPQDNSGFTPAALMTPVYDTDRDDNLYGQSENDYPMKRVGIRLANEHKWAMFKHLTMEMIVTKAGR